MKTVGTLLGVTPFSQLNFSVHPYRYVNQQLEFYFRQELQVLKKKNTGVKDLSYHIKKPYTINLESRYLLIQGVPAVGAMKELVERFALYGPIEQYNPLDEYPAEDFTEVYLIKFVNLQSARTAKKKMDEQSFFGGLLHVCYAPEFETVEETRKKLQERKAYIARSTKNKDYYMTKKKLTPEHKDMKDFRPDFYSEMSGFCAATLNTSTWNSNPSLPYSCELPLCYFSSQSTCSSGEHVDGPSNFSKDDRHHDDTVEQCNHNSLQKIQMNTLKSQVASSATQKPIPSSEVVGRFMPRTTQLQERKRGREDDRKLGAVETGFSGNEVMTGPLLPDTPRVDMHDDSLNTTANLIRNKLKEVSSSAPKPPEDKVEDVPTSRPLKQRRRI
ncbi:RNA-binding protein 48-like [Tupaia chinensis]|uniref:RNA-binding protein 48-like n=1 Tax=Tupaia chinensis TaxID=246437 RepID=UPI0003C8E846|nr:RNA-binding protein 48-like [Tupaia chinensis]